MKSFEFPKKTKERIVNAYNQDKNEEKFIDDLMALSTIQRYYGSKCKIHVFKTFINDKVYAIYDDDNSIISFDNEKDAYEFILY